MLHKGMRVKGPASQFLLLLFCCVFLGAHTTFIGCSQERRARRENPSDDKGDKAGGQNNKRNSIKPPQLSEFEKLKRSIDYSKLTQSSAPPQTDIKYPETAYKNLAEFNKGLYEFRATCVDEFLASSKLSDEEKQKRADFLRTVLRHEIVGDSHWPALYERASKLVDANKKATEDPLLLSYLAITAMHCGHGKMADELFYNAIKGFSKTNYSSRHICRILRDHIALEYSALSPGRKYYAVNQYYGEAVHYWLTKDLKAKPIEHVFVCAEVATGINIMYDHVINLGVHGRPPHPKPVNADFLVKHDGIPPYIVEIILGIREVQTGWSWRGEGWASTVEPAFMQKFHDYLKKGEVHFEKAWEITQAFPLPASQMVLASLGQRPTLNTWLDRAYEAQDDGGAAFAGAANFLLPRWGGSHEEMVKLAQQIANKVGKPESMAGFTPCAALSTGFRTDGVTEFVKDKELSKEFVKHLDAMIEVRDENSWDMTVTQLRNHKLGLLMASNYDPNLTLKTFAELKGKINRRTISNYYLGMNPMVELSFLQARKNSDDQQQVIDLFKTIADYSIKDKDYDEAIAKAKKLLSSASDELEKFAWRYIIDESKFRKDYLAGEWVSLMADEVDYRWLTSGRTMMDMDVSKSINMFAGPKGGRQMYLGTGLGKAFLFEFDLECEELYGFRNTVGLATSSDQPGTHYQIHFNPVLGFVGGCSCPRDKPEFKLTACSWFTKKSRIMLWVEKGVIDVFVNGKFATKLSSPEIAPENGFGLKNSSVYSGNSIVSYSNIRAKKLPETMTITDPAKRIEVLTKIAQETNLSTAWLKLGWLQASNNRMMEAFSYFRKAEENHHPVYELQFVRALTAMRAGEWKRAIGFLEETTEEGPKISSRYENLNYRPMVEMGNYQNECLFLLCMILCCSPDDSNYDKALYNKAYGRLGRIDGTSATSQRMVVSAVATAREGDFNKAVQVLNLSLRGAPPHFEATIKSIYGPLIGGGRKVRFNDNDMNLKYLLIDR